MVSNAAKCGWRCAGSVNATTAILNSIFPKKIYRIPGRG